MVKPFKVFVGADRSQLAAVPVLDFSIAKNSSGPVQVIPLVDMDLPQPQDPRQWSRTNFSFCRFAIPMLAGYSGEAIYLDADMLVFRDLYELVETCRRSEKPVVIQENIDGEALGGGKLGAPAKRKKQSAVMYLKCDELDWDPYHIIEGLDGDYTYEDLMDRLCIIEPDRIAYDVPFSWNSLEHYEAGGTALLHYTDMYTQPWVSALNPLGYLWVNTLREMIENRSLDHSLLREEIKRGYFRPSLATEVAEPPTYEYNQRKAEAFDKEDQAANFVKHGEVYDRKTERKKQWKNSPKHCPNQSRRGHR